MIKNIITSLVTAVIVSVIVLAASMGSPSAPNTNEPTDLGGTETILSKLQGGVQVGPGNSGTIYSLIKNGTCNILANASIVATTSKNFDCRIPATGSFSGIKPGDYIRANLVGTTTVNSLLLLTGVKASTTPGWATFTISNLTGAAVTPATGAIGFGSSTPYQIFRTVAY